MANLQDLNRVAALGFDDSSLPHRAKADGTRPLHVACSVCGGGDALVIKGEPRHEEGCPNELHECQRRGCNTLIPSIQSYCQDCN